MSFSKALGVLAAISLLICSCSSPGGDNWTSAIPKETSFVILPQKDETLQSALKADYIPYLEDVSASAVPLVSRIDSSANNGLKLKAIMLYPAAGQQLQPMWVTQRPDDFEENILKKYARRFTQNKYKFHEVSILNLQFGTRHIFIAGLPDFLLISESSLGIENAIRTYAGNKPGARLADVKRSPSSLIINTPSLKKWIAQLGRVKFQPGLKHLLEGASAGIFKVSKRGDSTANQFRLSGTMSIKGDSKSTLVRSVSHENSAITLDRYISSDAAGFGIFNLPAPKTVSASLPDTTAADAYLMHHSETYKKLAASIDDEFALVMYAESGFLSNGEYLYWRKLNAPNVLKKQLDQMSKNGTIKKIDGVYYAQSRALAGLIGSPLCSFSNFYINIVDDAAVIAKRKGLVELAASDRQRRSVISFEPFYKDIKKEMPEKVSSFFVTGSKFNAFLKPLLTGNNNLQALTASFRHMALATELKPSGQSLSVQLATFNQKEQNQVFTDNWAYNIGNAKLTGAPVFGNFGGSYNKEIIFATTSGHVYVMASDGTLVQQYSTGGDRPIGSPLIYNWYGTHQNVVLAAAGDKIYGWDKDGDLLPEFPMRLKERITTPLTVADLDHDKIPEAIVGTADRKLHVLNGRGQDLSGWPVKTNAGIESAPQVGYFQGVYAVVAFSANAVHAWDASGNNLPNFPVFAGSELNGRPVRYDHALLGSGVDGRLYAVGDRPPFADSLNVYQGNASSLMQAVDVSNDALTGSPFVHDDNILLTDKKGSLFLINDHGRLALTKSMGQPAAADWPARITDIDGNGQPDILALAGYGRLYGWQISDGKRIYNLPKAGMQHPAVGDIDGDGLKEIVAQTDEGVRCWTINRSN